MYNNNNNSSFLSHHDQCPKHKLFKCEYCDKVFTTGQELGGHKTCHRFKKQIDDDGHVNKVYKTMKVTFSLSCSPSNHNNDVDAKQKRHSWTRVFKTTVHHPPTASTFKPNEKQELPAVDLLSLLPPRSYNTKKRSSRYLVHNEVANNTAPIPLLDSVANLDMNHSECKRMKLSSNGNETEVMQKPFVLLTSDGIDETVVKEEKIRREGESAVSRVVRNFDLNELPTNDVEPELGPKVVRNLDLDELPTWIV